MRTRQITKRLLQRRSELLTRYFNEVDRAAEVELHEIEDVENATEQWDVRVLARMSDADALRLGRIVGALHRLQKGTYGRCVECGTSIEGPRLEALPEAEACYECASEVEAPLRVAR